MKDNEKIKHEYQKTLKEYLDEPLFITEKNTELKKEMDRNYWWINGSMEQITSLNFQEWQQYLSTIISNRQEQLDNSSVDTDLLFYCYHDHQAGQLRFNVISASHTELPFGCKYKEDTLDNILKAFLSDEFFGVIPKEMLIPISDDEAEMLEKEDNEFVAKVFIKKLIKKR